ncbi:MAG TPA: bifunctional phosphopantothenoylcysteine decarboxylase/phosphopantothenate--cysteine ligase CoaBC [Hellea balneolensis]|uniref:Coenzyme A biosynthesis bifunctional protein CoaBC n=1 Tax=Hellea balneolensis TaxID=287478 RepID=A0A7C3GLR3_9PROT|nr:bifunctional phosphopantothenoylcysteine decarboxylase/phosphopantothenate--cysteine ligase CoaBC [Hellea balneolensis]
MSEKRVLLIIGGGIAAFKSLLLIRLLAKHGIKTRVILTKGGSEFVTPLSIGALSGEKVYTDLFSLSDEAEMGHIELSRSADLICVVPATADLMAKAVQGLAGDLATTTLLATDKRVLYAPAMNVRMWEHAATQKNVETLRARGALFVGPDEGDMACGEFGFGRMAEPETIAAAIEKALAGETHIDSLTPKPLSGKHVLITAGPTREAIDPVRYLSNHSSGKQGYALARACAGLGARVTLVSGPVMLEPPSGVDVVNVESARDMLSACEKALPADVFVAVAAVADWRAATCAGQKIKKDGTTLPPLSLEENPDILKTLCAHKNRPELVVGFAAETNDVVAHAQAKLTKKACDWIVANDVSGDVMGGDDNTMIIVSAGEVDPWPTMSKQRAAEKLAQKIADHVS